MTIPHVHFSPLPSSAASYFPAPDGHTTPSASTVSERTFGFQGLELLMTSVPGLRHSSGGDAQICRAVARLRSAQGRICRPPCMASSLSLRSNPVLPEDQGNPALFMRVPRVPPQGDRTPLKLHAQAISTRRSPGLSRGPSRGSGAGFHARNEKCLSLSRQSSQGEWDARDLDLSSRTQLSSLNSSPFSVSTHQVRYPQKGTETAVTKSLRR